MLFIPCLACRLRRLIESATGLFPANPSKPSCCCRDGSADENDDPRKTDPSSFAPGTRSHNRCCGRRSKWNCDLFPSWRAVRNEHVVDHAVLVSAYGGDAGNLRSFGADYRNGHCRQSPKSLSETYSLRCRPSFVRGQHIQSRS